MSPCKKHDQEREEPPREDTSCRPNSIQQLNPPATRGSLGINLAASVDITLIDTSVRKIPTGVTGPVYSATSALGALLIGRSSAGIAGLIVLPGVIDADYIGEIQVCAYTLAPPLTIKRGTKIAQLVLFQKVATEKIFFKVLLNAEPKDLGQRETQW
ncbi:PREDICTED: deoxyuridine 5'-triphosphate nucleotidohydrolase-like [Pseudopodoces humilis]|uniref:deoxyuridine 5'-triphosphate nucleotidohydrolase-like n=1 Tax=Pseudopodoces humilis TaxID=181119 RepID=UPI0006B6E7AA|nr:PREDICTED: deoxyuridine 5'-triphosphate nucleotidohydrolase-like [Pseudopodoces humilis]